MEVENDYLAFVDPTPAVGVATDLESSPFANVAAVFAATLRSVHDLAIMPQYLVTRAGVAIELEGYVVDGDLQPAQNRAVAQLRQIASEPKGARSLWAVRRAVVTETWTAFECLANDALALVPPPPKFGRRAQGLPTIQQKFQTVFGSSRPDIDSIFKAPDLIELAEVRHLLVHRGGSVDEVFRRQIPGSEPLGTPLRLDGSRVQRLAASAVSAGVTLLRLL